MRGQTRDADRPSTHGIGNLKGWVLYDGRCALCAGGARRLGGVVKRRGFGIMPLQRRWVRDRLNMSEPELLREMRVLTPDGEVLGGAQAYVYLAGFVWWARPVRWFAAMPGGRRLLDRLYRWVAANRHCISGACGIGGAGTRKQVSP